MATKKNKPVGKKPAVKKAAPKKTAKKVVSKKEDTKPGKQKVLKQTEYSLIFDKKNGEVDLHFNLKNPIEDRYFAYALSLMDVHQTMEGLMKYAPANVVADFITCIRVLKGMSESIKQKLEEDAGYKRSGLDEEDKEKIKKMLATIKEKLQGDFPDAKIVIGKGGPQELSDALREAMEQSQNEIKENKKKPKKKKDEENESAPQHKSSQDLEMD